MLLDFLVHFERGSAVEEVQPFQNRRGRPGPPAVLVVLAVCAVSLSAAIVVLGYSGDRAARGQDSSVSPIIRIGQGVPTGYGAMAIERVERQTLVGPGRGERLDVTVALINLGAGALPVAATRVGLRSDDGALRSGEVSADAPGFVAPGDSARATFTFVLSATSRSLQLEITDATMARPVIVALGPSTRLPLLKELDAAAHGH